MSIRTWKKEFYPVSAQRTKKADALEHSILKWTGLLKKNLKRHGAFADDLGYIRDKDGREFWIGRKDCSLCKFFHSRYQNETCVSCPIHRLTGEDCDDKSGSPFQIWNNKRDARPMLSVLKKCRALI